LETAHGLLNVEDSIAAEVPADPHLDAPDLGARGPRGPEEED